MQLASKRRQSLLLLAGLCAPFTSAFGQTVYVNAGLSSGADDGSSWGDAYQGSDGLRRALETLPDGSEVWVAAGTYFPSDQGDVTVRFRLTQGLSLRGGFTGTESSPQDRPPAGLAATVLSGDYLGDDSGGGFDDNAVTVVSIRNKSGVLMDRCEVRGGINDSTVTGASTSGNGGGVFIRNSDATLLDCRFEGNQSLQDGAAVYATASDLVIEGGVFVNNGSDPVVTGFRGSALSLSGGEVFVLRSLFEGNYGALAGAISTTWTDLNSVIANCVFEDNTGTNTASAGAIFCQDNLGIMGCTIVNNRSLGFTSGGITNVSGVTQQVVNCILWGNEGYRGETETPRAQASLTLKLTHCIVEGGWWVPAGLNLASDPGFVNAAAGDYRLRLDSPAVDSGDLISPQGTGLDFLGRERFVQTESVPDTGFHSGPNPIDRGAFELQGNIGESRVGCVPLPNSTGLPAQLFAAGSLDPDLNDLTLLVTDLPVGEFGYFVFSSTSGTGTVGSGQLCLGAPFYRFTGTVLQASSVGTVSMTPDLQDLPQGQVASTGSTLLFQLWYRDQATSNLSATLAFDWL